MEEQLLQVDQGGLVVVVVMVVMVVMVVVLVISCKYIPQDCHPYSVQKVASQSNTAFVVVEQYQHQEMRNLLMALTSNKTQRA